MPNNLEITFEGIHRPITNGVPAIPIEKEIMIIDQTGEGADSQFQSIGTSEETLNINSDIGDQGLLVIKNVDDTNYVDIGPATGVYMNRIYPGHTNIITLLPTVSLFCLANTAAVRVAYKIYEL